MGQKSGAMIPAPAVVEKNTRIVMARKPDKPELLESFSSSIRNQIFMKHVYFPLAGFILVISCQQANKSSSDVDPNIAQQVKRTLDEISNAVKTHGVTAEFKWMDSSANFFWIPPGFNSPLSYDSVAKIMRSNAGLFKQVEEKWDLLEIHALSNDHAVFTGRILSKTTDTANRVQEHQLVETGIMVRKEDGWKLHCGHTSLIK